VLVGRWGGQNAEVVASTSGLTYTSRCYRLRFPPSPPISNSEIRLEGEIVNHSWPPFEGLQAVIVIRREGDDLVGTYQIGAPPDGELTPAKEWRATRDAEPEFFGSCIV
jgi:hypothetical protein